MEAINKSIIKVLDDISYELKKDNPDLSVCIKRIEILKKIIKEYSYIPDYLTFLKEMLGEINKVIAITKRIDLDIYLEKRACSCELDFYMIRHILQNVINKVT